MATNASKVFVIDDEQDILDLIRFHLEKEGYRAVVAAHGNQVLELARRERPDLILLDIKLPGISGLELLRHLKYDRDCHHLPVILLTAKGEEIDRILGFELGADDYVTKPFSVRELMLRIRRILTRLAESQSEVPLLACNGIQLDAARYEVTVFEEPVYLTATEFNLLAFLLRNQGRVLSRDRLLDAVWGYQYGGTTRTVDTHIQRLREKLGPQGQALQTVRGVGYRILEESSSDQDHSIGFDNSTQETSRVPTFRSRRV